MNYELIKARLNMNAVLKNLEDLVLHDSQAAEEVKNWDIAIQFSVIAGPKCFVEFRNGSCRVSEGKYDNPEIKLLFLSPAHFNRMMDGNSNPIPQKGLTKLKFLTKEFPKITDRLEYYLKPDDTRLKQSDYLKINTLLTLNTAVHAVKELSLYDTPGILNAAHIPDGQILFEILPEGPWATIDFAGGQINVKKEKCSKPSALMQFRDESVANDLLNGKSDAFAALASGDVLMKGRIPMIESLNLILDRIPYYIS